MTAERFTKEPYLAALFDPHNFQDSYEVLALRKRFLFDSSSKASPSKALPGPDRDEVSHQLHAIVEQFYGLDPAQLVKRLQDLRYDGFPDLQRLAKRLQRVAAQLPELDAAREDSDLDSGLLKIVKTVLVAPQKQANERKQKTVQTLARTHVQKRCSAFVKHLRRHYPGIYALESTWFDQLAKGKQFAKDSRRPASIGLGIMGIYFLFSIIARIVRMLTEND
ncbi:MAG: hypothetical protein ACI87O_000746 [Planctomycetota bacterium]|jgi:hypothetical protein